MQILLGGRFFAWEIFRVEARRWQSHRTPKVLVASNRVEDYSAPSSCLVRATLRMTSIAGLRVGGVGAGARNRARSSAVLRHHFSHATDFVDYFFDAVAAVLGGKDFRSR